MQQVIVYRNPLEAWFWESVQHGALGSAFLMVLGWVVLYITQVWLMDKIASAKIQRWWFKTTNAHLIVPTIIVLVGAAYALI